MRDIARALGMTAGNLYYYFRDKEDVLVFCQEDTLDRLERMTRWVAGLGLTASESLFLVIVGHVQCLNEDAFGSLAHLEVEAIGMPGRARLVLRRDRYERT